MGFRDISSLLFIGVGFGAANAAAIADGTGEYGSHFAHNAGNPRVNCLPPRDSWIAGVDLAQ
jgi:hypothetical protein